jgi:hypothetical protein
VLRSSLRDRLQAYRRVFGFTASNPPRGAKVNKDFHSLFVRFVNAVARFYRDKRVSEVVRQRPDDASFGSVAIVRRSGLDLRSNVKSASYGNIAVLRVELSQLLDDTMAILRSDDVRNLFGADDEWDVAEEILTRYLGKRPDISRRTRVASAGKEILRWVSQPFLLRPERQVFEALLLDIGDSCEEWLTSARAIGVTAKGEVA